MTTEEKANFKLPDGLGGQSKTIYKRIIQKVYDIERGNEVIDALQNNPAVAVPVVLRRLKQKVEEWRRAQREWFKIWRDVHNRNFYRALDHQGINFKSADKKALTAKHLVMEIEILKKEQKINRINQAACPLYQYEFFFRDFGIFADISRLIAAYLERVAALSSSDREKVDQFFHDFLRDFFNLPEECVRPLVMTRRKKSSRKSKRTSEAGGNTADEDDSMGDGGDDETSQSSYDSDNAEQSPAANQASTGTIGRARRSSTSLRRDVLVKNASVGKPGNGTDANAENGKVHSHPDSISALPAVNEDHTGADNMEIEQEDKDKMPGAEKATAHESTRKGTILYANSVFYVFLRIFQIIYLRLSQLKKQSKMMNLSAVVEKQLKSAAAELGVLQTGEETELNPYSDDPYRDLLDHIEKLFDGEVDQPAFEEDVRRLFETKAYIIFSIDKVIQSLLKQVSN